MRTRRHLWLALLAVTLYGCRSAANHVDWFDSAWYSAWDTIDPPTPEEEWRRFRGMPEYVTPEN
jgi:hypothetical protein